MLYAASPFLDQGGKLCKIGVVTDMTVVVLPYDLFTLYQKCTWHQAHVTRWLSTVGSIQRCPNSRQKRFRTKQLFHAATNKPKSSKKRF